MTTHGAVIEDKEKYILEKNDERHSINRAAVQSERCGGAGGSSTCVADRGALTDRCGLMDTGKETVAEHASDAR